MEQQKKNYFKILVHVIIPVFLGSVIYGLFRGIHFIDPAENIFPFYTVGIPGFIEYNLPDGLWLYALVSAVTLIWKEHISTQFICWMLLTIVLSYLTEIFQGLHFIQGTFDWYDLLSYSIALIFYAFNFKNLRNQFQTTKN